MYPLDPETLAQAAPDHVTGILDAAIDEQDAIDMLSSALREELAQPEVVPQYPTVQGYPIIATAPGGLVKSQLSILVNRGTEHKEYKCLSRYVVAWYTPGDAKWYKGRHFDTLIEAAQELDERTPKHP